MRFSRFVRVSHKLTYSYSERNAILSRANYPLMPQSRNRIDVPQVISQFQHIQHTQLPGPDLQEIQSYGRIANIRRSGKNLTFIDLEYNRAKLQVVVNFKKLLDTSDLNNIKLLRKGDSIAVHGRPWRTQAGELSILASSVPQLLSACLHPPPTKDVGEAVKRSNRVAELKAFEEARIVLEVRDAIVCAVASFLKDRDFTQVQTPILSSQLGGANAEPFITKSGPALRVAPELWLKRLIIGGFERVFEIGPSFRNEGVDATHNPEFTTCEFYQSFTTLEELIDLTKQMLAFVVEQVGTKYPQFKLDEPFEWNTVDFFTQIEGQTGHQLPTVLNISSLMQYFRTVGVPMETDNTDGEVTTAKLLDKLAGLFIEEKCVKPTFIINPPALLAPLAKQTTVEINGVPREISRRFELIINGREYVNAYEEENDPVAQLEKLRLQAQDQNTEQVADIDYVKDMEWGLPPTGGWGMGIDRLVMLLTKSDRINQVLTFGAIKQVTNTPEKPKVPETL